MAGSHRKQHRHSPTQVPAKTEQRVAAGLYAGVCSGAVSSGSGLERQWELGAVGVRTKQEHLHDQPVFLLAAVWGFAAQQSPTQVPYSLRVPNAQCAACGRENRKDCAMDCRQLCSQRSATYCRFSQESALCAAVCGQRRSGSMFLRALLLSN